MFKPVLSAALLLGLVQLGCANLECAAPAAEPAAKAYSAGAKHECKKGKNGKCDHKAAGAKHECKKGKNGKCDHKVAGAKQECKK